MAGGDLMKNLFETRYRREAAAGAVALALIVGLAGGWQLRSVAAGAEENAAAIAAAEIDRFYQATSGKVPLADVLGEAFQLMRTDGSRYDREGYLARPASLSSYSIDGIEATQSGDVLTATFLASLTGDVGGTERQGTGDPRLAVFSKVDGAWKLQAFANLGQGLASGLDEEAKKAVESWVGAVASGDANAVRAVLAPEFQIVRSDGSAHGFEGYLAGGMAKIENVPGIADLVVTGYGDQMIVRYALTLEGSVDGKHMEDKAPRLTVFRRKNDAWLVVAHANFAKLDN
jgi:ketosteroid isomerase-like protein